MAEEKTLTTQEMLDGCRQQLASAEREIRALRAKLEETQAKTLDEYPLLRSWIEACDSGALEEQHTLQRIETALGEIVRASARGKASVTAVFEILPGGGSKEPAQLSVKLSQKEAAQTGRIGLRWVSEHGELLANQPAGKQTEIPFLGPKGRS